MREHHPGDGRRHRRLFAGYGVPAVDLLCPSSATYSPDPGIVERPDARPGHSMDEVSWWSPGCLPAQRGRYDRWGSGSSRGSLLEGQPPTLGQRQRAERADTPDLTEKWSPKAAHVYQIGFVKDPENVVWTKTKASDAASTGRRGGNTWLQ